MDIYGIKLTGKKSNENCTMVLVLKKKIDRKPWDGWGTNPKSGVEGWGEGKNITRPYCIKFKYNTTFRLSQISTVNMLIALHINWYGSKEDYFLKTVII